MSSRNDHRRRDRSWERSDRDRDRDRYSRGGHGHRDSGRRRSSRSASPRRGDRDRDRRDYRNERDDKEGTEETATATDTVKVTEIENETGTATEKGIEATEEIEIPKPNLHEGTTEMEIPYETLSHLLHPHVQNGEAMDGVEDDDSAMMAMMGMSGFGTTKGKHVEGNQEGTVDIKKQRTWRQYMNRRGGFNRSEAIPWSFSSFTQSQSRPLDKIK
ncbi:hypothetical protein VNI00_003425 [Paramarasmius palmivorus]|uniref:U4/U6.U5 small nuclear ribonucleoprotein 27kDa protein domain-containing protein n=1 Tax=Paramarasmius palmivorus TaxID=297713 RepID=A0AAW0DVT2_9AGAR